MRAGNLLLIGSGAFFAVAGVSLVRRELRPKLLSLPAGTPENFPPPTASPPTRPTTPIVQGPVRLENNPIALEAGRRYLVAVTISGPLSIVATKSRVAAQARELGFVDVAVSETPPSGRPPLPKGDYYVEATYAGPPKAIARSQAGGRVQVADAWQLS